MMEGTNENRGAGSVAAGITGRLVRPLTKRLKPDEMLDSVFHINEQALMEKGISGIIIDLDNTLVPWGEGESPAPLELLKWAKKVKEAGISLIILSNNHLRNVEPLATELDIPVIALAAKPSKRAFSKALEILGLRHEQVAVVGDQVFTDVLGGKRSGLYTILVTPLSEKGLKITKIMRFLERIVLGHRR